MILGAVAQVPPIDTRQEGRVAAGHVIPPQVRGLAQLVQEPGEVVGVGIADQEEVHRTVRAAEAVCESAVASVCGGSTETATVASYAVAVAAVMSADTESCCAGTVATKVVYAPAGCARPS